MSTARTGTATVQGVSVDRQRRGGKQSGQHLLGECAGGCAERTQGCDGSRRQVESPQGHGPWRVSPERVAKDSKVRGRREPMTEPHNISEEMESAGQYDKWTKLTFWSHLVYSPINKFLGLTKFQMLGTWQCNHGTSRCQLPLVPIFRWKGSHNLFLHPLLRLILMTGSWPNFA